MDTHVLITARKGDTVQVRWHTYASGFFLRDSGGQKIQAGAVALTRKAGLYRVLFKFKSGNLFALPFEGAGDPQVIEPKYVIGKVEERRAA